MLIFKSILTNFVHFHIAYVICFFIKDFKSTAKIIKKARNSGKNSINIKRQLISKYQWCNSNNWSFEKLVLIINFDRFLVLHTVHTGVIYQFFVRWILYCHCDKSTGRKTGKSHLCAVHTTAIKTKILLEICKAIMNSIHIKKNPKS